MCMKLKTVSFLPYLKLLDSSFQWHLDINDWPQILLQVSVSRLKNEELFIEIPLNKYKYLLKIILNRKLKKDLHNALTVIILNYFWYKKIYEKRI